MTSTTSSPRYLTKSRFKQAVECPTKLFYTKKEKLYADNKNDDEFLKALAEGGFQVGELAKLMYPGGVEVEDDGYEAQINHTLLLLKQDKVTIYEAAICFGNLFARVDVLHKDGTNIDIIEVKAKSFDSTDLNCMRGKKGGIDGEMLPYLQDIAFQTYLFKKAFPNQFQVNSFLMMADKSKVCSVDGLNQFFKIHRVNDRPHVTVDPKANLQSIGKPILKAHPVDEYVDEICSSNLKSSSYDIPFEEAVIQWSTHYADDEQVPPVIGGQCAKCEFRNDGHPEMKSGLYECWQIANDKKKIQWSEKDFQDGTVLDIWNYRGKDGLIKDGILKMGDVTQDHLMPKKPTENEKGLSNFDRQWMQVSKEIPGGESFYLDRELMLGEMATWQYPLNFIDFETSRVAIPFFKGQAPYSNIAFQFSHHVMQADGSVSHQTEFLSTTPGSKPNYDFVRALIKAIGNNTGTVFMWWPHENTTLNAILTELEEDLDLPPDAEALKQFICDLTYKKEQGKLIREGTRKMVDLCTLSKQAFFYPATNASSSIKKVLPAVLDASSFLKQKYSEAIYGKSKAIPSLNFDSQVWWQSQNGKVRNPYELLPRVFEDFTEEELSALDVDDEVQLKEGGAASMAYARLQFEDLAAPVREKIELALKKYCELDTLAMVMIVEAWKDWSIN
jgi:hypothetical protein